MFLIYGAYLMGSTWVVPENAEKSIDPRKARKNEALIRTEENQYE